MKINRLLAVPACLLVLAGCGADNEPNVNLDGSDVLDGWDAIPDSPFDGSDTVDCSEYVDTDGDTIADHHEGEGDPDEDGVPNYLDDDSDNDGISDAAEAGDSDMCTGPRDTDADRTPDFLDPDSDNDGVSDRDETALGTDPTDSDTDDDGISDLVETEYGSDPLDPADSPRTHGDFVFIVDYMEDPVPPEDTLVFGTDIQIADVYITVDTSGSMGGEVANLQTTLKDVIVPGITSSIPNVQLGVGRFEDCPGDCPNSIANLQNITDDEDLVQAALDTITETSLCGGDEPYALALYITATGDVSGTSFPPASCTAGYIGWPCFRPAAIPIFIQIGDEPFCDQPFPSLPPLGGGCTCPPRKMTADAAAALNLIHAKYIGINTSGVSGSLSGPRPAMEEVARSTGSMAGSTPLVFDGNEDGTGLGTEIVDAVGLLSSSVPLDISTQVWDVDDGAGDTVDASIFVERVEPNAAGGVADPVDPTRVCEAGLSTADWDSDGYDDYFNDVEPGTIVCFDIIAARNESVPRISDEPQLYTAEVRVMGDWVTILDSREIYFLIPPDIHIEIPE